MKTFTLAILSGAIAIAFGAPAFANTMSKADHKVAKDAIEAEYKSAHAACASLQPNPKDLCKAEAKGRENVAFAELEAKDQPSRKTRYEVRLAKAEAEYAVARERCNDQVGNAKDVCVKQAKATRVTAKADAKVQMETADANSVATEKSAQAHTQATEKITEVRKDAVSDKRDADLAVELQKCDALAGDAKSACTTSAKARYSKS
jgi:hypothetical protein